MRKITTIALLLTLSFVLVISLVMVLVVVMPKTIVVPDEYPTIQDAINNASAGDTVFVKKGIYDEPVTIDKPLSLIGEDSQNTIIEMPYAKYSPRAAVLVTADNVTVSGFTIRNNLKSTGIIVEIIGLSSSSHPHPFGVRIIGNNIMNNTEGIHSYSGSDLIISGNNITGNGGHGIYQSSSNSTILENNIMGNRRSGIIVDECRNVTIKGNNIKGNGISGTSEIGGIYIRWDGPFYIYGNNITDNRAGIQFGEDCNNSTVRENNIERNDIGVELRNFRIGNSGIGSGNIVYGNNFIDSSQQALVNKEYVYAENFEEDFTFSNGTDIVSWDNGTTGNYWSNYNGTDNDGDGIGDTPYVIDHNNQDNYPIMTKFIIPEFPSWTVMLVILTLLAVAVAIYKRRLRTTKGNMI